MNRLATMRAKFVTVARPAQLEDSVEVDFEVKQDGVVIEGGKSDKHPLVLGKGVFIPGFEEGIVGMQEEEEKTMTLSFPDDYHATHLAGKPAEFAVKLRLVQERQIPTVDDEFAKSLGLCCFRAIRCSWHCSAWRLRHRKSERARDLTQNIVRQFFLSVAPQQLVRGSLRKQQQHAAAYAWHVLFDTFRRLGIGQFQRNTHLRKPLPPRICQIDHHGIDGQKGWNRRRLSLLDE